MSQDLSSEGPRRSSFGAVVGRLASSEFMFKHKGKWITWGHCSGQCHETFFLSRLKISRHDLFWPNTDSKMESLCWGWVLKLLCVFEKRWQHFSFPCGLFLTEGQRALEQEVSGLISDSANTLASLYVNNVNSKMRMIIVPNIQVCGIHPHWKCVTYQ